MTAADIKAKARALGFDLCGIAPATNHAELGLFPKWLARGYAGTMTYLHRSAKKRVDIQKVVPGARSVIATATVYNVERPYSTEVGDPARAAIARYAWGDDYHDVIGRRLDALMAWMHEASPEPFDARAYVDTGPVQERVYARHAGLGWIGKNSCVINPALGSWLFLGEIICTLALEADEPALDQCGTCTLCIEACPTGAIVEPGVVDATRCISYLTIEQRKAIPPALAGLTGSRVYGCDVCQDVCPWNQTAAVSADPAWRPREAWDEVSIDEVAGRSDAELEAAMEGSAMARAGVRGLRRNLEVAAANRDRAKRL